MKAIARTWCALSGFILLSANPLLADYWESRAHGPGARVAHSVVFTGHEVIVWGGGRANTWLNDGARYDAATDTWTPISANHTLAGRWWHAAVWTGKEMIVWGGRGTFFPQQHYGDGARYNPATDTWTPMNSEGAPSPRSQLSAVWTGAEMIVWGGTGDDFNEKGDGARYNPETDTWTPLPAAPLDARLQPTAVWSGGEMIIFGGLKIDNPVNEDRSFGDGAAYDPTSNTWRVLSTNNAPRSRTAHTAVWTGKEMMVWGGRYLPDETFLNSGGSYDPVQDRWRPISENGAPQARSEQAAVWSGTELIVWGGYVGPSPTEIATGGRYNPVSRTWTATTMEGAPQARFFGGGIASVWTGDAMFIYGGWDYPIELNTTALYYPPVVTWLSPPNGATFLPGATISLMASVVTNDALSFVEFFAASATQMMNLGRGTLTSNNVYLLLWSNAPAGTFQMHAEADDNLGRRGVSGSVQITVATPTNITWTGADPSGYWSAPANWFPAGVPTNGADLVFPGGLPPEYTVSTNDLTDSIFRSIRFDQASRHTIRGNPITLTHDTTVINHSGTNVIACDLTFSGTPSTQYRTIRGVSGELTVIGNVGGGSLLVRGRLVIRGQFTGGSLLVDWNATLALYGDNPYAVSAEVHASKLLVQGSQPNLNIRMFRSLETLTAGSLSGDGLVGDVTGAGGITPDSTLSVKNVDVSSLNIYLNGTNVSEYGSLVASGDVSVSGGFLYPSAGFNPQAGQIYTIVEKTSPGPITSAFLGPEGTLTTLNGMVFRISYVGGDGNDVTLTAMGPPPTVTVVRSDATAFESGDIGMYTITRTGSTASSLTINYTLSGTAQNGTDYNSLSGSVTILAGANSATVSVVPMDDTAVEGNETVTLTLATNNAYTIGSPNSATVTIVDNDQPQTHTWMGADPSGYWSAPANWSPAGVPVNGADLVFPGGLPPEDMVSTNDLTDRIFRSIRFLQASRHTIRGNPITLTNRSDCIINSGTNVIACDLTFSGTPPTPQYQYPTIRGSFGSGELTVIGNVGGGSLYFLEEQFGARSRLVIRGQFTGGSIRVNYGTLALYGDNPNAVSAEVQHSDLLVQGSQPNLNIRLFSIPLKTLIWSSLRGDGQVGNVTGSAFIVLDSTLSVRNVNVTYLTIILNGTNVGEYGRLVASGDVSLYGGSLLPSAGFNPQAGQVFTIVEKTSPGPITSTVFGPEGTITYLNGMAFRISYVGGDGNDVTLTAVTPVPIVLGAVQRFGTQFVFSYSADVGLRYAVERSATLSNWTTIWSNTANVNPMTFTDTAATNRMNFYRVRRLPNP